MFQFEPIGVIESVFREKFGTPRQPGLVPGSTAVLKINHELNPQDSLVGLEEFSYVWLIFVFHKNSNKAFNSKIYPPRMNGDKIGVFATRSPHRPNPIGITCARIEKIKANEIFLSGVDIIDGTPVLDIKPYIPAFDSRPEARTGWIERIPPRQLRVEFSPESLQDLNRHDPKGHLRLQEMIQDILIQDPRNPMDKEPSRENKPLGFFLSDYNVIFQVREQTALVLCVETRGEYENRHREP